MNIKDIIYGDKFDIRCKFYNDKDIENNSEGKFIFTDNKLLFKDFNNHVSEVEILDKNNKHTLNTYFARGYDNFVYIKKKDNKQIFLTIIFFAGGNNNILDDLKINYDEKIIKQLKDKEGIEEKKIENYLKEQCVLEVDDKKYLMIKNQFYDDSDNILQEKEETDKDEVTSINNEKNFVILGEKCNLHIDIRNIQNMKYYAINKVVFLKSFTNNNMPSLVSCKNIVFTNKKETIKPHLDSLFQKIINQNISDNGSYINTWGKYNFYEIQEVVNKAKWVAKCSKSTQKGNEIECILEEEISNIKIDDTIIFPNNKPENIENISDKPDIDKLETFLQNINNREKQYQKEVKYIITDIKDKNTIVVKSEINKHTNLKDKYALVLLTGDIAQLERKLWAIKQVKSGDSANPLLRFLIEKMDQDSNLPQDNKKNKKIKPTSLNMLKKVFSNEKPTENQIKAINIALNTPDIALIQGPPGTGKTTIIQAILERLNEEYYIHSNINTGKILVTAYQHDAVDNIVSKLKINGIPGIKFGGKKEKENNFSETIDNWINNISENVNKNYNFKENEIEQEINKLLKVYYQNPSYTHSLDLLKYMFNLEVLKHDINLKEEIANQIKVFQKRQVIHNNTLQNIYAIRLDEASFKDDGIQILYQIKNKYELQDEDKELIEKIAKAQEHEIKDYLEQLKELKERLLEEYIPENEYIRNKPNDNIINLTKKVRKLLNKHISFKDIKNKIVHEFKQELENNRESVLSSLKKYNVAFSVTIQQSKGKDVLDNKKKFSDYATYDVLIVDEVARSNPMDLFVALVQAKDKIILVGDHRQLPHIIDEKIKEKVESGEEVSQNNLLDISIFEYLIENIKRLEKKDNIKRVITLDTQYRTHNILGDFINKNFYEKYGESFSSPREYSEFNIKTTNILKPCIWYNIENSVEKKDNKGSRYNEKEIECIEELIKGITEIKESIGIISFYRAQADEIKKELEEDDKIRNLIENNQIEIGTVDAFQGKEFDIIFLSLVRCGSNQDKRKTKEALFGHLMSENRLCVAMSRAKRSLVVVGNLKFMKSEKAKEAVPALYNYARLCESNNGEIKNVK